MKKTHIFIASILLPNILCPNEDGSGYGWDYGSSSSTQVSQCGISKKLRPHMEHAKNALLQKTGTVSTFKKSLAAINAPEFDKYKYAERYSYLAGIVVEQWQNLRRGEIFLNLVQESAQKRYIVRSVPVKALTKPLKSLFAAPNFETFRSRLKKYMALFNLLENVKVDFYPNAQSVMKGQVLNRAVAFNDTILFGNDRQHYEALTLLFKSIGFSDEDVAVGELITAPLSHEIAVKLVDAENCIIRDDAIGITELLDAHPCLPLKAHDGAGSTLMSTAMNIHPIKDRSFFISKLLEEGCKLREQDLRHTVHAICNSSMQEENDTLIIPQIQALAKLYHLLSGKYLTHLTAQAFIQHEVNEFLEFKHSLCQEAAASNTRNLMLGRPELLRKAVKLTA